MALIYDVPVYWTVAGYITIEMPDRDEHYTTEEIMDTAAKRINDVPFPDTGEALEDTLKVNYYGTIYEDSRK